MISFTFPHCLFPLHMRPIRKRQWGKDRKKDGAALKKNSPYFIAARQKLLSDSFCDPIPYPSLFLTFFSTHQIVTHSSITNTI